MFKSLNWTFILTLLGVIVAIITIIPNKPWDKIKLL